MHRGKYQHHAFSMIELFVVIAAIAVLAAIILPANYVVFIQAKRANCASNLHQIGIQTHHYADTHNNELPDFFYSFSPGNSGTTVILIVPKRAAMAGWDAYDENLLVCPTDKEPEQVPVRLEDDSIVYRDLSYTINIDTALRDVKMTDVPLPENLIWMFDGSFTGNGTRKDGKGKKTLQGHFFGVDGFMDDAPIFRHNGKANVLFLDGHVEQRGINQPFEGSEIYYDWNRRGTTDTQNGNGNGNGNGKNNK